MKSRSPKPRQSTVAGPLPLALKLLVGLLALAAFVAVPVLVASATSDRVLYGAGAYSQDSTAKQRAGREIFRETCAGCHTLSAAGTRGAYGPNLDTLGITPAAGVKRVENAIKNGGVTRMQMPKQLLVGENATLVAEYVTTVVGK